MTYFWNRLQELAQIKRHLGKGELGYITGRRRVGKTATLQKANELFKGIYHQAIEGTPQQQLFHLAEEISDVLTIFRDVVPKNWNEFFRLLSKEKLPKLIIFDEFPYWVQGDPTLASILQKWVDHDLPKMNTLVLVSGSSQSMLYSQFLNQSSPLYGRTTLHLHLEPMGYHWFCKALKYNPHDPVSFARFSLVGGVPHYWKLMPKGTVVTQANVLYFEPSAILAEEPINLIRDEGMSGSLPKAILDFIGRGVAKPSELASRLCSPQGNLSRPLAMLMELRLIHRELPFGESSRTTKKVLYSIQDPALSFYYGTYLPSRSRWRSLNLREKESRIDGHVSRQWENFCRRVHPGASRYWEGDVEIDLVAPLGNKGRLLIAECKWSQLRNEEENKLLSELQKKFYKTRLSQRVEKVDFHIFSKKDLPLLAGKELEK